MGLGMLRVTKVVALSIVAPKHDHDASTANNKGVSLQFRDAKWISVIEKLRRFWRNWGDFEEIGSFFEFGDFKKKVGMDLFHVRIDS